MDFVIHLAIAAFAAGVIGVGLMLVLVRAALNPPDDRKEPAEREM